MADDLGVIELLKYEISVDGNGVIEGGRVREEVVIAKKNLNVRKAYAPNDIYKVGWVYDYDVSYCMICISEFGWFIRRHHVSTAFEYPYCIICMLPSSLATLTAEKSLSLFISFLFPFLY
jgi:hypothetical protein